MTEHEPLSLSFDVGTIQHLGLKLYSTLPAALAELIANSFDADASEVRVHLVEGADGPEKVIVEDDGIGLTYNEMQSKFLVIGRNRREGLGDVVTAKFGRKSIGRKGLGKLAVFGIATEVSIESRSSNRFSSFVMNWDSLRESDGSYWPEVLAADEEQIGDSFTRVVLSILKRQSPFDANALAKSLSRIFVPDCNFRIIVVAPGGQEIEVTSELALEGVDIQFEWPVGAGRSIEPPEGCPDVTGVFSTSLKPLPAGSRLRGVSLFSRGKLVQVPTTFTTSSSSHFFQYLTGAIQVDFVDELPEDVISTNRQELDWDDPLLEPLRRFLESAVRIVQADWRDKRKGVKVTSIDEISGVSRKEWLASINEEGMRNALDRLLTKVSEDESVEEAADLVEAIHDLVPQYPELHWRFLHDDVRNRVEEYYRNRQFGHATDEGVAIYFAKLKAMSKIDLDGLKLVNRVLSFDENRGAISRSPIVQVSELNSETGRNIQSGQFHLSQGLAAGVRNPMAHGPMDEVVPEHFDFLDCLNLLSLVSFLCGRLESAIVNDL